MKEIYRTGETLPKEMNGRIQVEFSVDGSSGHMDAFMQTFRGGEKLELDSPLMVGWQVVGFVYVDRHSMNAMHVTNHLPDLRFKRKKPDSPPHWKTLTCSACDCFDEGVCRLEPPKGYQEDWANGPGTYTDFRYPHVGVDNPACSKIIRIGVVL